MVIGRDHCCFSIKSKNKMPLRFRAKHDFNGDESSLQLSFTVSSIVLVKDHQSVNVEDGWGWGKVEGTHQDGWFPSYSVEPCDVDAGSADSVEPPVISDPISELATGNTQVAVSIGNPTAPMPQEPPPIAPSDVDGFFSGEPINVDTAAPGQADTDNEFTIVVNYDETLSRSSFFSNFRNPFQKTKFENGGTVTSNFGPVTINDTGTAGSKTSATDEAGLSKAASKTKNGSSTVSIVHPSAQTHNPMLRQIMLPPRPH